MFEGRIQHDTIICDKPRRHVARITLNREKVMNAYSWRMTQERGKCAATGRTRPA